MSGTDAPERYRHTQIGYVILASCGVAAILCLVIGLRTGPPLIALVVAAVLAFAIILFVTLTVVVRQGAVEIRFGPGVLRKRFPLSEFTSVRVVRNKWYYGWGIRLIPGGWLYNVSGLDAVELVRKNGRVLRIGTDEPVELERAIREAVGWPMKDNVDTTSPE